MSLVKSNGNMYPWVTHMHSHLRGACPHACPYCYATKGRAQRFAQGPLHFKRSELSVGYGSRDGVPKTIFIEHTHDLFACGVEDAWIADILTHCNGTPYNQYVFQSRNTKRMACWSEYLPVRSCVGTTIETNRKAPGRAPHPKQRALGMIPAVYPKNTVRFMTIEPVLDFDVDGMLELIDIALPDFINIGADSKGCGLAEPSGDKLMELIRCVQESGIEIKQKTNLERLLKGGGE